MPLNSEPEFLLLNACFELRIYAICRVLKFEIFICVCMKGQLVTFFCERQKWIKYNLSWGWCVIAQRAGTHALLAELLLLLLLLFIVALLPYLAMLSLALYSAVNSEWFRRLYGIPGIELLLGAYKTSALPAELLLWTLSLIA